MMHELDALIQPFIDRGAAMGAAVAILRDGEVAYTGGFGTTSVEQGGVPVTPQTLFTYGSICKTLCATLVMRLVEQGLLQLDTPIVAYLPGFHFSDPGRGARVTLRHVLSHTTGLPPAGKYWGPRDPDSLRRFVYEQVPHYAFLSEPGTVHLYSNTVFCVAGHVAEAVTGRYYDDLIQEYVFDPLGMRGVTFDPCVAMTYPVALPHERAEDGSLRVLHHMTYNVSGNPSSFGLGSVEDLANLARMYLGQGRYGDQQFLSAASVAEMHRLHASQYIASVASTLSHVNQGYGLGFSVGDYQGRRAARHGGMNLTYNCFFDLFPDDRAGVVLLTNQCDEQLLMELVAALYDYALGIPHRGIVYLARPAPQPSPHAAAPERYAGTYVNVGAGDLATVTAEGDTLTLSHHGQAAALVPIGNDEFYIDQSDTRRLPVAFVSNAAGSVTHAMVGGEPYHPIAIDPAFRPDAAQLRAYEGLYKDPSNQNRAEIYTVRLGDGALIVAEGTREYRYTAISDRRFLGELGMIEFEPSPDGAASILVSGRATRYYPIDSQAYRTRRVIRYLVDGVRE